MAEIYISDDRGDDSTGTGTATNPYATVNKAAGASGIATAGDLVVVEPGIYREKVAIGVAGSSGSPITIVGDGDGSRFRTGGYSDAKIGDVELAAWTNDTTPMTTTGAVISANNKSYVTLRGFLLKAGGGSYLYGCLELSGGAANWIVEDCHMYGSVGNPIAVRLEASAGVSLATTLRRCKVISTASGSTFYGVDVRTTVAADEWSLDLLFENSNFYGSAGGIRFNQVSGGSGSAWSGGSRVQGCGFFFCNRGIYIPGATALANPIAVYGCNFAYSLAGISAGASGQVVEDGNAYASDSTTVNASVTPGSNSITVRPSFSMHDERLRGGVPRPCFEPSAGSPLIGAGNYGTPPSTDSWNRARPDGGAILPSIGSIERHDVGARDTTYKDAGSPACLKLTGKSTLRRPVLVKAGAARTITVKVRWDGNHGDGSKPQAALLASSAVGFAGEVKAATSTGGTGATPNAYETLTFTAFTPTADGVVWIEMRSRAAADNGAAYFDTIGVS
jgi:hypothetical protein